MSLSANFPTVAPSLTLDFANTKQLDPRITFTRATTATYYDGVTTAKAEQNLLLQSQDFTTTWINTETTDTANSTTAPDGTSTADTVTETAATSAHNIYQSVTITTGLAYTFSVFVKKGDGASARDFVQVGLQDAAFGANSYANFNINTGSVTVTGAGLTSASIVSVGSGWYRCIITDTSAATGSTAFVVSLITTGTSANQESYAGNTNANIFLWGAQLEQRSAVSSYTATTTQPITNYIPVLLTAAAGVARFDHNPITDVSLGLLIEEQRTNLLTYSADFSNAAWFKDSSITIFANQVVAPDGTLTADFFASNANTGTKSLVQGTSGNVSTAYCSSLYVKPYGVTACTLALRNNAQTIGIQANIDFSTVTATVNNYGSPTSSITPTITAVGNGWYRLVVGGVLNSAGGAETVRLFASISSSTEPNNGLFIWGAQLEAGAFPTSYIATTTTTVQRNADLATMTGTNFSSWYNASEGTIYAQATKNYSGSTTFPRAFQIDDGTNNNAILTLWGEPLSRLYGVVSVSGSNVVDIGYNSLSQTANYKTALAYKTNDFAFSANAATVQTDTIGTLPTVNRLQIGVDTFTSYLNGTIRKLSYYPLRLTNAQLQALTGS